MTITLFTVQPNPTYCGNPTSLRVRVEWAGPHAMSLRVCVDIPGPCTFQGQSRLCLSKAGTSPLEFLFQGAFSCPFGTNDLLLVATASDTITGVMDTSVTGVTVQC